MSGQKCRLRWHLCWCPVQLPSRARPRRTPTHARRPPFSAFSPTNAVYDVVKVHDVGEEFVQRAGNGFDRPAMQTNVFTSMSVTVALMSMTLTDTDTNAP